MSRYFCHQEILSENKSITNIANIFKAHYEKQNKEQTSEEENKSPRGRTECSIMLQHEMILSLVPPHHVFVIFFV